MLYTLHFHNALCQLSLFWGALCVLWELSSPNRDRIQDTCSGSWVLTTGLPGKSPINYIWRKLGTNKQKKMIMSSVKLFLHASYENVSALLYSCQAWSHFRIGTVGTSWWSSGFHSAFALQGLGVRFLIRKLRSCYTSRPKKGKSWYFNWILFQEECLCVRWFNRAEGVNSGLAISAYYRVVKCRVEI